MEELKYYVFRQNNSFGNFVAPAVELIIQATCEYDAVKVAISNGVYFDPEYEIDCECCGKRWSEPYPTDEVPKIDRYTQAYGDMDGVPAQVVIMKEEN